MIAGGAALPTETQVLWERLGVRVVQGYGVTECSPAVAISKPDGSTPIGSPGPPLRGVEVRLSPEGELLVRGPNVMAGYWRDPERTAEVLHDGWYATGDLGTIDAQGNIRIVGRARDLIVLPSGMNVWPQDVEDVLRGHPSVKDAVVLAVPTAAGGATLHTYLLPSSPSDRATDVGRIVAEANARLAQHQRIATASWWEEDDFPRTALLKVRRHLLPIPEIGRATVVDSVLESDDPVGHAIGGIARVSTVQPTQTLAALGLDSLSLVELAIALEEKTGKVVHEDTLRTEMTVDEVRAALQAAPARVDGAEGAGPDRRAMSIVPPTWLYTWGRPFRALGKPFDLLLRYAGTPIVVLGAEHLDTLPDRVILAGTHRSFADMSLVRYALAHSRSRRLLARLITANAAEPSVAGPFAWAGVLMFGAHPVDQHLGREVSLRALARTAKATGGSILIFPQGTHSTTEAELAGDPSVRFRAGVAHLAEALDLPVVPFGLAGPEHIIPPDPDAFHGLTIAGLPVSLRRGPLAIAFGAPLRLEPGETAQAFAARLQNVCSALTREAERSIGRDAGADRYHGSLSRVLPDHPLVPPRRRRHPPDCGTLPPRDQPDLADTPPPGLCPASCSILRQQVLVLEDVTNTQILLASTLARIAPKSLGEGPVLQQSSDRCVEGLRSCGSAISSPWTPSVIWSWMPPVALATIGRPFHIASVTVRPKPSCRLFCTITAAWRCSALTMAAFSSASAIGRLTQLDAPAVGVRELAPGGQDLVEDRRPLGIVGHGVDVRARQDELRAGRRRPVHQLREGRASRPGGPSAGPSARSARPAACPSVGARPRRMMSACRSTRPGRPVRALEHRQPIPGRPLDQPRVHQDGPDRRRRPAPGSSRRTGRSMAG